MLVLSLPVSLMSIFFKQTFHEVASETMCVDTLAKDIEKIETDLTKRFQSIHDILENEMEYAQQHEIVQTSSGYVPSFNCLIYVVNDMVLKELRAVRLFLEFAHVTEDDKVRLGALQDSFKGGEDLHKVGGGKNKNPTPTKRRHSSMKSSHKRLSADLFGTQRASIGEHRSSGRKSLVATTATAPGARPSAMFTPEQLRQMEVSSSMLGSDSDVAIDVSKDGDEEQEQDDNVPLLPRLTVGGGTRQDSPLEEEQRLPRQGLTVETAFEAGLTIGGGTRQAFGPAAAAAAPAAQERRSTDNMEVITQITTVTTVTTITRTEKRRENSGEDEPQGPELELA